MSFTDNERTEVFQRIGQLEGASKNEQSHHKDTPNGGGAKAFASILVILTIIGGMSAIIMPIQQQIDFMAKKVDALQIHASDGHPDRIEAEINRVVNRMHIQDASDIVGKEKVVMLQQEVAVLKQQMLDGTRDRYYARDAVRDNSLLETKILTLEKQINDLKEMFKNAHIYTNGS